MAEQKVVTKVSIADGCIACDICETLCPDAFVVEGDVAVVRPDAAKAEFTAPRTAAIQQAALECPVSVIHCETKAAPAGMSVEALDASSAAAAGGDPGMQSLLASSKARGGAKLMEQQISERRKAVQALRTPAPADEQFMRMLQSAKPRPAAPDKPSKDASRRGFISTVAIGWAAFAATCAAALAGLQRFMFPNVLEEPDPRVRCGPLDQYTAMPPGSINEDFKPQGIWLYRSEDRLAAISIICTHLGCIPNWLPNDRKFKCPCHGSGFTAPGINFEGPAPRPLERFAISIVDGQVVVDRSRKFLATNASLVAWEDPNAFVAV